VRGGGEILFRGGALPPWPRAGYDPAQGH